MCCALSCEGKNSERKKNEGKILRTVNPIALKQALLRGIGILL
jgi:hypothetical protein